VQFTLATSVIVNNIIILADIRSEIYYRKLFKFLYSNLYQMYSHECGIAKKDNLTDKQIELVMRNISQMPPNVSTTSRAELEYEALVGKVSE